MKTFTYVFKFPYNYFSPDEFFNALKTARQCLGKERVVESSNSLKGYSDFEVKATEQEFYTLTNRLINLFGNQKAKYATTVRYF